jgi:multiple sugar transport system permease protein
MEKGFSALASIGTRNGISVFIERHAPVLFVAPGGLILGLVIVGPILLNVVYSFLDWHLLSGTSTFIGLQNYQEVLFTSEVWLSFRRTLIWAISSVAIQLLLGMMAALCLQQIRYGRKLFRTLLIVPWAFPPISTVFIWRWMLDAVHGIVNYALLSCGIVSRAVPWFGTKQTAMFSLVAMNSWYGFPFMAMAISAGLQAIPRDYYEVGAIEGASGWKQFWQVTVPSLREILAIIVVLRFIWVFNNFDFIFMTTGGGPGTATQTLPIYAYQIGWVRYAMGKSAAVTVVMTAIMMTLGLIYMRALGARRGEA